MKGEKLTMDRTPAASSLSSEKVGLLVERKLRRVFIGSLGLCVLIAVELLCICGHYEGVPLFVRTLLLPVLLWACVVTSYVFKALWTLSAERRRRLVDLAERDPLTHAFTAQYLEGELAEERRKAMETGKAAAFAYVRLIGLEKVNESHGFVVGDAVLRAVAELIMDVLFPKGIVARLAGQQFAVLLPGTGLTEARSALRRTQERIRAYHLDLAELGSISGMDAVVGIAAYPVAGETLAHITQAAISKAL